MVIALAIIGAQSNVWEWKDFQDAGFNKNDLLPVSITIYAANKISVNILGTSKLFLVENHQRMRWSAAMVLSMSATHIWVFFFRIKQWLTS